MKWVSRIFQALVIILVLDSIAISIYYGITALLQGDEIPVTMQVLAWAGVIAFALGVVYVLVDRLKTRKSETFRRVKW